MFCAFEGPPRIVRLHGRGEVVLPDDPRFEALLAEAGFEEPTVARGAGARSSLVDVTRIGSSCGYGVPLMDYAGERPHMDASTRKRAAGPGPGRRRRLPGGAQRARASTACPPSRAEHAPLNPSRPDDDPRGKVRGSPSPSCPPDPRDRRGARRRSSRCTTPASGRRWPARGRAPLRGARGARRRLLPVARRRTSARSASRGS